MPRLAQLLVRVLLVSAIVTLVAAEQPEDAHYTVDSIVPEDDAVHASVPKHAAHRTQAPTITNQASPDGAMTNKVMLLLKQMIAKKQMAQKKAAKKHTVAKPAVHKRVVHQQEKKMSNKVMMLLKAMQHKAAPKKQHKIAPKVKKAPKKVKKVKKKLHVTHVKNGVDILKKMVLAQEAQQQKREAEIARVKKEVKDKKAAAAAALQKKKVDPMEAALKEASNMLDAKEAKEVQKKHEMAQSLQSAQATDGEDEEDFEDDDLPVEHQRIEESAAPTTLSSKGKALLGRLMAAHMQKANARVAAKIKAKKQAEAKKLADQKAAKLKAAKKAAALAKKDEKEDTAAELLKQMGIHAEFLPHREHKHAHKAEKKKVVKKAKKAAKKKGNLVDQAIMEAMNVDLHSLSSKPAKHSHKVTKSDHEHPEEDRLAEEEAFSREVAAQAHRESATKIKRRRDEAQLRQRAKEKAEKQFAPHKKAPKATSDDDAAAIAAKLFK